MLDMFSMPKRGTLERIMVEKLMQHPEGVTFMDFVGTGITEENIDQIAQNLRNAMYESEDDSAIKQDS